MSLKNLVDMYPISYVCQHEITRENKQKTSQIEKKKVFNRISLGSFRGQRQGFIIHLLSWYFWGFFAKILQVAIHEFYSIEKKK